MSECYFPVFSNNWIFYSLIASFSGAHKFWTYKAVFRLRITNFEPILHFERIKNNHFLRINMAVFYWILAQMCLTLLSLMHLMVNRSTHLPHAQAVSEWRSVKIRQVHRNRIFISIIQNKWKVVCVSISATPTSQPYWII